MKRYRLGDIRPEWKIPAPSQPLIRGASDRVAFGTLSRGCLTIYRLGYPVAGSAPVAAPIRSLQIGDAKIYALGPGGRTIAVALGTLIELSEETKGPLPSLTVATGEIAAVAFSASGRTLWAIVQTHGAKSARLHAWDTVTLKPIGDVPVLGPAGSVFELVTHPDVKLDRVGVDAAAGQDGSSFTFVDREDFELKKLAGSHDGDDGVALGGLLDDGVLLISREAIVVIDVNTEDRLARPARATLPGAKDEMIFDYLRGYIDDFWVVSGRFDDRDPDETDQRASEDATEGRLRVYDKQLNAILEMPSTDDIYDTPWAVVGLVQHRVLVCQSDALMLYNLSGVLSS